MPVCLVVAAAIAVVSWNSSTSATGDNNGDNNTSDTNNCSNNNDCLCFILPIIYNDELGVEEKTKDDNKKQSGALYDSVCLLAGVCGDNANDQAILRSDHNNYTAAAKTTTTPSFLSSENEETSSSSSWTQEQVIVRRNSSNDDDAFHPTKSNKDSDNTDSSQITILNCKLCVIETLAIPSTTTT